MENSIHKNLKQILARINELGKGSVKLVAVSKFVEISRIITALEAGQRIFGENYVQEAQEKFDQLTNLGFSDFEFHFVGSLQSNKAKDAVGLFSLIHSVDRIKIADALANKATQKGIKQRVLLQVNISKEPNKSGVMPEGLAELLKESSKFDSLEVEGLMTIGQEGADNHQRIAEFIEMNKLFNISKECLPSIKELSMGMSDDFELAIKHGASIVRVGTAIFGRRN